MADDYTQNDDEFYLGRITGSPEIILSQNTFSLLPHCRQPAQESGPGTWQVLGPNRQLFR